MIDIALLDFALTMVASPPQLAPKTPRQPAPKMAQVQKDQRQASDITLRPGTEMGVRVNRDVAVTWSSTR